MKLLLRVLAISSCAVGVVLALGQPPIAPSRAQTAKAVSAKSSSFVENAGQWDSRVQFLSKSKGMNLWVTAEGPVFDFQKFVPTGGSRRPGKTPPKGYIKGHVVKMTFVNARPSAVTGQTQQKGFSNYFIGKDPSKWVSGARSFEQVTAERPYDGISIRYSIDQGTPRYDVIVKPGADPSQVGIKIEGADDARVLENGNLELKTSLGTVEEHGLTAYQDTPNGRAQVPCKMVMEGNTVRFDTGSYDVAKPLVIDPLVASTFLGGDQLQNISGLEVDSSNNIYVDGYTSSPDYPTSPGAYQAPGSLNVFVSKLDPTETSFVYSSTIGGTLGSYAYALAIDGSGNAFLTGVTGANDYPTTTGAYDTFYNGGANGTTFVTELNPTGSSLVYSTYLGGTGGDIANGIALDSNDDAVIVGQTTSTDFPVTASAYQATDNAVSNHATTGFVTELNSYGSALVYSTYLGGSGNLNDLGDAVEAVVLDSSNNPVVCGQTASADFPVTAGCYQKTNNEVTRGQSTGFVTKLNSTGSALIYSTFLGGSGVSSDFYGDSPYSLGLDSLGNVTVAGSTTSQDFPTTAGAYLTTNPEAAVSGAAAFVTRLNPTATALVFSTYFGGTKNTTLSSSATLDALGDVILVGETYDSDFPTTAGAFDTVNQAAPDNNATGFVSEISFDGTKLVYSSFLGGNPGLDGLDECGPVQLNGAGYVVVGGETYSPNFPTTSNALETVIPYQEVGFVTTLNISPFASFTISPNPVLADVGTTATITLASSVTADTYINISTPSSAVTIPSQITIPTGTASKSFPISNSGVISTTQAPITATLGSASQTVLLTIVPAALASVQIGPSSVVGGATVTGTIQANISAYQGNLTVQVGSNSSAAFPQPYVHITHGTKAIAFPIQTVGVDSPTPVTITASYDAQSVQGTFTVNPPTVSSVSVAPGSVTGGSSSTGTVNLSGQAGPSGAVVSLSSTTSEAAIPPTVTVPAGNNSATFTVNTTAVSSSSVATLSASFNGSKETTALTLTPAVLSGLSVAEALVLGGTSANGTVQLASPAGPNGDVVKLNSSTAEATVPSTVKVLAGATSATFTINTTAVSSDSVATFTATYGLSSTKAQLILLPAPLSSLSVSPTSLVGGTNASVTVTLANIAGPYGNVIKFASSSAEVAIPATKTVPAGTTSYTFSVPTSAVSSTSNVTITDTFWVYSQKVMLTLTPAPISSLSFTTNPVVGGQTTTAMVTLAGPAGPSGDVVKLSSNSADATVPASVTVPAGQTSVQFTVHTVAVSASKTAGITATLGTSTTSNSLTISP